MTITYSPGWTASIREVVIGATVDDGGTRRISYRIGGESDLPCIRQGRKPLIAFEICDDPALWPDVVRSACTKLVDNPPAWAEYVRITSYNVCYTKLLRLSSFPIWQVQDRSGYLVAAQGSTGFIRHCSCLGIDMEVCIMRFTEKIKAYSTLAVNLFHKPVTVRESFGFIAYLSRGLPRRDDERCTGCGACNERCSSRNNFV